LLSVRLLSIWGRSAAAGFSLGFSLDSSSVVSAVATDAEPRLRLSKLLLATGVPASDAFSCASRVALFSSRSFSSRALRAAVAAACFSSISFSRWVVSMGRAPPNGLALPSAAGEGAPGSIGSSDRFLSSSLGRLWGRTGEAGVLCWGGSGRAAPRRPGRGSGRP